MPRLGSSPAIVIAITTVSTAFCASSIPTTENRTVTTAEFHCHPVAGADCYGDASSCASYLSFDSTDLVAGCLATIDLQGLPKIKDLVASFVFCGT
jgi:hypothetical protein